MKVLTLCGSLVVAFACSSPRSQDTSARFNPTAAELDVLECVFRYQFDHNESGRTSAELRYIFLELEENHDPPDSLLSRFIGNHPPVEPASHAEREGTPHDVQHKDTQGEGIIFRATAVRWIDDRTVEVDGGYYHASRSASGYTYRVERQGDGWVVVSDHMHWIS